MRFPALLIALAAATAAHSGPERPPGAPAGFKTELRVAVDPASPEADRLRREDEARIRTVLERRLFVFGVEKADFDTLNVRDMRIRIPADQVTPEQIRLFLRQAKLEVRHLQDVQTSLRPDGRYAVETVTLQAGDRTQSTFRFRDRRTGLPVRTEQLLARCPRVATEADLAPGSAAVARGTLTLTVRLQFNPTASRRLAGLLKREGTMLVSVLDGEVISLNAIPRRPKSEGRSRDRKDERDEDDGAVFLELTGGFHSEDTGRMLAGVLNSGSLPAPLKLVGTRLVGD